MLDADWVFAGAQPQPGQYCVEQNDNMRRHAATVICSGILAIIHIAVVVIPLVSSGGCGEGQAFLVYCFDFPLVVALDSIPGGGRILYHGVTTYVLFFSIVGTVMYASAGGFIGYVIDRVRIRVASRGRREPNKELHANDAVALSRELKR